MQITRKILRHIIKEALHISPSRSNFIILESNSKKLYAEVADSDHLRNKGLMYRTALDEDCGMLFSFTSPAIQSFWMKNTLIPLSIAFINESGKIINIEDLKPHSLKNVYSLSPVKFALEMKKGWFQENCIHPGSIVRGLSGII